MNAHILIIEDNYDIQQLENDFLTSHGFEVDCADDGIEGMQKQKNNKYDLIILNVKLPKLDGFSICKMIRKYSNIPIVFTTDSYNEDEETKAFDFLGDDYIVKPFSFNVLLRRIRAILRRTKAEDEESYLVFEKIKLNLNTYVSEIDDENIELTLKEFNILKMLIKNYPQVITREKLLDNIWGYDYFGDTRIVDAHIKNLRKKIVIPYIKTVKGVGYTLVKAES